MQMKRQYIISNLDVIPDYESINPQSLFSKKNSISHPTTTKIKNSSISLQSSKKKLDPMTDYKKTLILPNNNRNTDNSSPENSQPKNSYISKSLNLKPSLQMETVLTTSKITLSTPSKVNIVITPSQMGALKTYYNSENQTPQQLISRKSPQKLEPLKSSRLKTFVLEIHNYPSLNARASSFDECINNLKQMKTIKGPQVTWAVASQIVGRNIFLKGPYGPKLKLFLDYSSTGQEIKFIQDEMYKYHKIYDRLQSETSNLTAFANRYKRQSEEMILRNCRASPQIYSVLQAKSTSLSAIELLQKILGIHISPQALQNILKFMVPNATMENLKDNMRKKGILPLVLLSPYEERYKEQAWSKQLCDVRTIAFGYDGMIDLNVLFEILEINKGRKIIACFSSGSNVSGVKMNILDFAELVKKYNGTCIFDYDVTGAYSEIDLSQKTPEGKPLIDGIFIHPHKLLGGNGTNTLLILNKSILDNFGAEENFNSQDSFNENDNFAVKTGNAGLLSLIKASFAFELKNILQDSILPREISYSNQFLELTTRNENLMVLGPYDPAIKIPHFSFNIVHNDKDDGRIIHPALVCRVLNDVFGIQARVDNNCDTKYIFDLFKLEEDNIKFMELMNERPPEIGDGVSLDALRPGWVTISLHYILEDYEIDHALFAVEYLCRHGYKFLPDYKFDMKTNAWTNRQRLALPDLKLGSILEKEQQYAKDDEGRKIIFKQQQKDSLEILKNLPDTMIYENFEELGRLAYFYAERSNVIDKELFMRKFAAYQSQVTQNEKKILGSPRK